MNLTAKAECQTLTIIKLFLQNATMLMNKLHKRIHTDYRLAEFAEEVASSHQMLSDSYENRRLRLGVV